MPRARYVRNFGTRQGWVPDHKSSRTGGVQPRANETANFCKSLVLHQAVNRRCGCITSVGLLPTRRAHPKVGVTG